ncbi:MAG: IclR family transcriptional regulator [Pelagibacterium sp.]|jgi:IclR family transcriptional regulator, acetate operon repressor|uniref:IclR family transcriptional regulator n=1 Tax=Pelagibacterium sp. TaxID=1967288 RepID=UPI0032EC27CF
MSTVGKAADILEVFSIERPEIGLSDVSRMAGFDKATCHRLLLALTRGGLVERNPETRLYRLGPAVVRLARIREAHFPFMESAREPIETLSKSTGETAHLTEYDSGALTSLLVCESSRANRISVAVGDRLPLNATASGLAFLAFGPSAVRERLLGSALKRYTEHTIHSPEDLNQEIANTLARGYSIGNQGREDGVFSVGAPVLNAEGIAIGAVSLAAPVYRVDDAAIEHFGGAVMSAAQDISIRLFGAPESLRRSAV